MLDRKIIHIDMDAFFAAVEQRDTPQYRNLPVVVGGDPNARGVVSTCNYEARKYGIHSAMPAAQALRRCPNAIFLRPRFEAYREASHQIRAIFREFTDQVEPVSLDEAYLNVTGIPQHQGSAIRIAQAIKRRIVKETQLTASAGVSYNKFLAKLASDVNKPDGIFVITPEQGPAYVQQLPIGRFHGVGKATERKMQKLGINTGNDLKNFSTYLLQQHFGKSGEYYYHIARGIDVRPVVNQRSRKSLGTETTFQKDIGDFGTLTETLKQLALKVWHQLTQQHLSARTLTIKVKFDNFEQVTRRKTLEHTTIQREHMSILVKELLAKTQADQRKVRLLGVCLSGLSAIRSDGARQLDLFEYKK